MTVEEQEEFFKTVIKNAIPMLHTERKEALDFADKFNDAVRAFNKLSPDAKSKIVAAFVGITAVSYPLQFNPNYNRL